MLIVDESIRLSELQALSKRHFGDFVKAVVDVEEELLALDAELHSDLEALLLQHGSRQENLWGINLYPEAEGESFIEYDSLINVRPAQSNRSRGVEDASIRKRIVSVVAKRVVR